MRVWTYIPYPHITLLNLNQMDKMKVVKDVSKRLTDRHINALYEALDKYSERIEALKKENEEREKYPPTRIHRLEWFLE